MRKALSLVLCLLGWAAAVPVSRAVDQTWEFAVQVSATVQTSPARIQLTWPQDQQVKPINYTIYRKAPEAAAWSKRATLPGTATNYVDSLVKTGTAYEYQIVKGTSQYTGYGYLTAGIEAPLTEARGKLLLVVDKTCTSALTNDLALLQQDLVGDGWTVQRRDVSRTDSVTHVKGLIKACYAADPAQVKAVFLFGHVPVPYSGDLVPDGHAPDHQGAWPCDGYYGDMTGTWTDTTVNDAVASDSRNRNVPGDGKFDQSSFPAPLKLMVGRVDMANLPGRRCAGGSATFPDELELLRNYLRKDHEFRTAQTHLPRRGVVGDYFGYRNGEAFAASGWRNLAALFGAGNVTTLTNEGTWLPTLHTNAYLFAYGCGPGTYTSMGGLGNSDSYHDGTTTELYTNDVHAVFTLLFGSWLGDWDSEDNLMRTALAMPTGGLTCGWSGRPHWFMHPMGLGETVGYCALLTQNNGPRGLYQNQLNSCAGQTHIALMGDPTLRLHPIQPPSNLSAVTNGASLLLSWTAPADSIVGYHVYQAPSPGGPFTRLTATPITATSYHLASPAVGSTYMVRAIKLETSASGSYYNASQGRFLNSVDSVGTIVAGASSAGVSNTRSSATLSSGVSNTNAAGSTLTPTGPIPTTNFVSWVDDAIPAGATPGADGGDSWAWVNSNPTPASGTLANQSSLSAGLHQHYFYSATKALTINTGDVLMASVYIDPNHVPSELMLQWNDGSWEHRAYWGAGLITYGTDATPGRRYMGALPAAGKWVTLQVPASQVGLEGSTLNGMSFTLYDGRATWDNAGKYSVSMTNSPGTTTNVTDMTNVVVWVNDSLPANAVAGTDGGDTWTWVKNNPAPYSGTQASQSAPASGLHQHYFYSATQTLPVSAGEVLLAAVYLDPSHIPSELMLQWNDGSWEHRAYWGANDISYGTDGTTGRHYMGPLPAPGQWTLLQVPASQVGLEGSTLNGMSFSLYDGAATWDYAGKASAMLIVTNAPTGTSGTNSNSGSTTNTNSGSGSNSSTNTNTGTGSTTTNTAPTGTNTGPIAGTNDMGEISLIDYAMLELPKVGDNTLHVLAPNLLELKLINTQPSGASQVTAWNLVNSGQFSAPPASAFTVTVNGQTVGVTGVGFKRRPLYAPYVTYDLRVDNSLYLQLASPVSDNQTVEVKNPSGSLWPSSTKFIAAMDPQRYSPAIHVNEEGYMPNYPKKAMVGYYLGNLGEMPITASSGFKLVDANTGKTVYTGSLVQRPDSGFSSSPAPYQKVYQADFTSFNTPGEYRLVVPGMGGSLPFLIDGGIAMSFARGYALGLYHQRCGEALVLPYTRFTHDICHAAPASVPTTASAYPFTWKTVAGYANTLNNNNPPQIAPALTSPANQLFPFVNQGPIDTTGGHHDAGDYSKYTINSASLVAYLMFEVDSLSGVAQMDNLGIPESGDGISDVMQEAKWEADYLAKLQDSDGGFYFLVYPVNREYESNVTPDHGDPQVVWPKTTSVTAAAVAALAQCATSPAFKKAYPTVAAKYLQQAKLGWQFLMNAVNKYGKNGAYQKITHYGDNFADNDELAWAACQMYLATGDAAIHKLLLSWFDPADSATWRWGWWHMSECYGHTIRSYAFAVQSGRAAASQLDATFLAKCQAQIAAAGDDALNWSQQSAYGTSFPTPSKSVGSAGWYFSCDQAFDMAVAYQLNPKAAYLDAMLANMNFEGGCNPVNVTFITGMGWKRQRDIVSQWAINDTRVLPPSGIPVGNISTTFDYLWNYGSTLGALCFPSDGASTAAYPPYDRWGDSWNVDTEMVVLNQARGLGTLALLAAQTSYKTQPWKSVAAKITVPTAVVPVGSNLTVSLQAPGVDLSGARIAWEARDQEPCFGSTFTFAPANNGAQWVEAEAQLADGRRIFAQASFTANSPNIVWVNDALPAGATPGADGGDAWSWVTSNPAPQSGNQSHQSALASGEHQHYFSGATATLNLGAGDTLYTWVYLDPNNKPSEIMLQWNDGSWEHRAYWGADSLGYGTAGTPGHVYMGALPTAGQWVQLKVPASQVNLQGSTLNGMAFSAYGGRVTWDTSGRISSN